MIFRAIRVLGAFALLGVGAVHLQQYYAADYSAVPTIGPLFLLNGIGSGILGITLLFPIERVFKGRTGNAAVGAVALGGVTIAVGALAALFISENGGLFGFIEPGYSLPVVLAIVTEAATLLLLAPVAMISLARALRGRITPPVARGWPTALDGRHAR
ncbi:MAG TPA: hypothetical protein VGL78_01690 [Solirubrobacteraceae bacterium]|jgi:hypothetical protein